MKFALSYYTIASDAFMSAKYELPVRVLYSSRSGKALTISDSLYDKISMNDYSGLSYEDLEQLIETEAIVPEGENELETVISANKGELNDSTTLSYIIQPTAQCQLGCDYCGQAHTKKQIDADMYENILKRIEYKLLTGIYTTLRISWFGSEPLVGLRNIRELTPRLKLLAEAYNCRYGAAIVTNGLSLKPNIYKELVTEYDIDGIEITLDGVAEFHDKRRHTKEGEGTFDIIFKNLLAVCDSETFEKSNTQISIRCNIDKRNYEGVSPLIQLLAKHGLQKKIKFYPSPIHSWGNDAHTLSLEKEEYANKEIDWIIEMAQHGFPLTGLIPGTKRSVCIAVTGDAEVVDAYGNIFNCTEVPYVPIYENSDYILGNIKSTPADVTIAKRSFQDWNDQVLNDNNTCSTCKMLPVCGGMCPKSWAEGIAACPSNKFNIKDKLVLAYMYTNNELPA